jgi:hypothetical protein
MNVYLVRTFSEEDGTELVSIHATVSGAMKAAEVFASLDVVRVANRLAQPFSGCLATWQCVVSRSYDTAWEYFIQVTKNEVQE